MEAPAGTLTAASSVDLPDDGRHRWFVRLTNTLGGVAGTPVDQRSEIWVATPAGPPAIVDGPSGRVRVDRPAFSWTGTRSGSRWVVQDAAGTPVQSGESPTGGGGAPLAPLPDGAYVLRAVQRNSAGAEGESAVRAFTVDTTAPAFSWRPAEPGAVSTWRVRGARGAVVSGPTDTTLTGVAPKPLETGAYAFEVRQTDDAGNVGPWGSEPFSILPSQATPRLGQSLATGTRARVDRLRRNTRRLTPAAGTRLYNVQLLRVGAGGRLVRAASAFPSGTRCALTALTPGACYVWRVWPYRRSAYSAAPLGISDFCVTTAG